MAKRDCPDCRKRLQPFWMPASRIGGEVELDRCRECGGVWFDAGELTEASGKTVRAPMGPSARNCPSCGAKHAAGQLEPDENGHMWCRECGGAV
jgi:DNA-directed RNA polymerase subunit M/transcription elongation factor TFIIS